jgi:hypothetical protein
MALENKYNLTVNLKAKRYGGVVPNVTANDNTVFEIYIIDDTVAYPLLNTYRYTLVTYKKNKASVIREGSLTNGLVRFELGSSETTVSGKVEAMVQIYDEADNRISSAPLTYNVIGDPSLNGSLPVDDTSLVIANESLFLETIEKAETQKQRVDDLIAGTPQPSEVIDSRGGFPVLRDRLNDLSSSLAQRPTITEVDTKVAQIVSGSPKGIYSTLSALQSAFPTGTTGVYLVTGDVKEVASLNITAIPTVAGNITVTLNGVATNIAVDPTIETTTVLVATKIRNTVFPNGAVTGGSGSTVTFTASVGGVKTDATYSAGSTGATGTMTTTTQGVDPDGKWYYWNGSAWTAGGTYQSTGIADSSITSSKLDDLATKRFDYYTKIFKPQNPFINLGVINADNTHTWVGINATLNASDGSNLGVKLPHIKASKALTVSFTNASSSNISLPLINKPAVPAIQGAWFNKADLLAVDGFVRHDFGMFDASNVQISIYPGKNLADTDLIVGSKYTFQTVGSATYTVTTEILAEVNGWYYIASYLDKFPAGANVVKYKPYIVLGGKTVSGTLRVLNPIVVESTDTVTPHKYFNEDEQSLENGSVTVEKLADDTITPIKLNRTYENLYLDKSKALQGYAAGTTQGGAYVAANWYLSDFIAVKEGDIVQANLARNTAVTNWNASKQIISQYEIGATATSISYTIPAGVSFIRVNIYKDHWADYTLTINGSAVNRLSLSWLNVKQENLDPNISLGGTPVSKWEGTAGAQLGDSITEYGTIVAKMKESLKLSMYSNWGRAGKPMANGSANGNGICYTGVTDVNWSLYDFAVIFAGTNDFRLDVPLGELGSIDDTTFDDTTFYGAYRKLIEHALTVKPTIRLFLWTPLQRNNAGYDVNFVNAAGHKLIDYVNAIKEIGKMYGIPVLDLYATSGFTKLTLATFTTDGLHPNAIGDDRIVDCGSSFLEAS